jgi:hypothetical protein
MGRPSSKGRVSARYLIEEGWPRPSRDELRKPPRPGIPPWRHVLSEQDRKLTIAGKLWKSNWHKDWWQRQPEGWFLEEWRIAMWMASGLKLFACFAVGTHFLAAEGWDLDNDEIASSLLRSVDLACLIVYEGLAMPWGIQPKTSTIEKTPAWNFSAAAGTRLAAYIARQRWKQGHDDWMDHYAPIFDSVAVLPAYPLEAVAALRPTVLMYPTRCYPWERGLLTPHHRPSGVKLIRSGRRWYGGMTREDYVTERDLAAAQEDSGAWGAAIQGRAYPRGWPDRGWPGGCAGSRFRALEWPPRR